jgi:hypothetical protein
MSGPKSRRAKSKMPRPRTQANTGECLRVLIQLVVRHMTLQTVAPTPEWSTQVGGAAWRRFSEVWEDYGWYVDEQGAPYPDIVETLGEAIKVLHERLLKDDSFVALSKAVFRKYPRARAPLMTLSDAGANPLFILYDCLWFRLNADGTLDERPTPDDRVLKSEMRRQARRITNGLQRLNSGLVALVQDVPRLRRGTPQDRWVERLKLGHDAMIRLMVVSREIAALRPQARPRRFTWVLNLCDFVESSTGKPHALDVAELLIATQRFRYATADDNKVQVANALDQLRHDRRQRGERSSWDPELLLAER